MPIISSPQITIHEVKNLSGVLSHGFHIPLILEIPKLRYGSNAYSISVDYKDISNLPIGLKISFYNRHTNKTILNYANMYIELGNTTFGHTYGKVDTYETEDNIATPSTPKESLASMPTLPIGFGWEPTAHANTVGKLHIGFADTREDIRYPVIIDMFIEDPSGILRIFDPVSE